MSLATVGVLLTGASERLGAQATLSPIQRAHIASTPLGGAAGDIMTSVSIGVAAYPEHGDSLEALSKCADRALYASKTQGRNRVTVYAPEA